MNIRGETQGHSIYIIRKTSQTSQKMRMLTCGCGVAELNSQLINGCHLFRTQQAPA